VQDTDSANTSSDSRVDSTRAPRRILLEETRLEIVIEGVNESNWLGAFGFAFVHKEYNVFRIEYVIFSFSTNRKDIAREEESVSRVATGISSDRRAQSLSKTRVANSVTDQEYKTSA
jgi:hypothetical protein